LLLVVPLAISDERLRSRQSTLPFIRDRIEEADRAFFERVAQGYEAIAVADPGRFRRIDSIGSVESVRLAVWHHVEELLKRAGAAA
jgi:dTMP kinase